MTASFGGPRAGLARSLSARNRRAAERHDSAIPRPAAVFSWSHIESEPMPDSPLSDSPYEVLGVPPTRMPRRCGSRIVAPCARAHPDTGGDPERFHAVQLAWELVGTPEARAAFDRGGRAAAHRRRPARPGRRPRRRPAATRVRSPGRTGIPAGSRARRYLVAHARVGGARRHGRRPLRSRRSCGARHATSAMCSPTRSPRRRRARSLVDARHRLHGLARPGDGCRRAAASRRSSTTSCSARRGCSRSSPRTGAAPVAMKRGELVGEVLDGERPIRALAARAKAIGRAARVKPTALIVVVPDEHADEPLQLGGSVAARSSRSFGGRGSRAPCARGCPGRPTSAAPRSWRCARACRRSCGSPERREQVVGGASRAAPGGVGWRHACPRHRCLHRRLRRFIPASPSSYHAAAEVARRLEEAGFDRLDEADEWPADARAARRRARRRGHRVGAAAQAPARRRRSASSARTPTRRRSS